MDVHRFPPFEFDSGSLQLRKHGHRLKLQRKPALILRALLERPGEPVSRKDLHSRLWPADTFVDFDLSLNVAIKKLRDCIDDSAEGPRFIETVAGFGYRFIGECETLETPTLDKSTQAHAPASPGSRVAAHGVRPAADAVSVSIAAERTPIRAEPSAEDTPGRRTRYRNWVLVLASCTGLLSIALLLSYVSQSLRPPHISQMIRITNDPRYTGKLVIGTDEGRVFLKLEADSPVLGQVPIDGGEITTTAIKVPDLTRLDAVSPNGNIVVCHGKSDVNEQTSDLWIARTTGAAIQYLARGCPAGASASWSPDGKEIVYSTADGKVYTVPSTGGSPHLLHKLNGQAILFAYSPDGSKIRFSYRENNSQGIWRIWEMTSKGENLHEVLPNWRPSVGIWNGRWTPDGNFFVFLLTESGLRLAFAASPDQIWAIDERRGLFRMPTPDPVQLTSGPGMWSSPFPSRDGRVIFAESFDSRGALVRYNREKKQEDLYLGGMSAEMLDFSRDGKSLIYTSFPDGSLWRANRDGSGARQISKAAQRYAVSPRISPDGSQIVFVDFVRRRGSIKSSMFLISSRGGAPEEILPDDAEDEYDPTWSPDGTKLAYGPRVYRQTKRVDPATDIRIVDIATKNIRNLPAPPRRARSPRWSPDGRYIVCLTAPAEFVPDDGLEIYDFNSAKWSVLLKGPSAQWPTWSPDSRWIYYVNYRGRLAFYRIAANGGQPELTADLPEFRSTGFYWTWFGVDPDGNPLMLRDDGTDEIYALTLER